MLTLAPLVLPGVVTAAGAYLAAGFARDLALGLRSAAWAEAPGRVVDAGIHAGTTARYDSAVAVAYEYAVAGRAYRGRRVAYTGAGAGRDRGRVLRRYAPGAAVTVRYDPRRPARAVLEPGVGAGNLVRLVLAVGVLWFAAGALLRALAALSGRDDR